MACSSCGTTKVFRVVRGISYALAGLQENLYKERISVCRSKNAGQPCESYRGADVRCTACNCFLVAKTRVPEESCPKGYWNAV